MYELRVGSRRLVDALERRMDDPESLRALADDLYYCEDQLKQDIQALVDFYEMKTEEK